MINFPLQQVTIKLHSYDFYRFNLLHVSSSYAKYDLRNKRNQAMEAFMPMRAHIKKITVKKGSEKYLKSNKKLILKHLASH